MQIFYLDPLVEPSQGSSGFDRRQALRLYPAQAEMDALLREDTERFTAAVRQALGRLPAREPLVGVVRRYLDGPLSLSAASAELGLSDPLELRFLCATRPMSELGLAPLASDGVVRRDTWEDAFPAVVRALGLGVPLVPLDGLTHRQIRPGSPEPAIELATNHPNNVFTPGDELVITMTNRSGKPLYVELIGTSARGRKVLLTPGITVVASGEEYRFFRFKVRAPCTIIKIWLRRICFRASPGSLSCLQSEEARGPHHH